MPTHTHRVSTWTALEMLCPPRHPSLSSLSFLLVPGPWVRHSIDLCVRVCVFVRGGGEGKCECEWVCVCV